MEPKDARAAKMQGVGASCQFWGLEPYLAPLRPLRGRQRLAALAMERWVTAQGPEVVLGQDRPPSPRVVPMVELARLEEVAQHLAWWDEHKPSMTANELAGIAYFMLRNVAAGRTATDYGDIFFEVVRGAPSDRTRRRYRARWGNEAGRMWWREELQHYIDLSALVRGGRTPAAARLWLRDNPGKHAHEAPPPRKRRAA